MKITTIILTAALTSFMSFKEMKAMAEASTTSPPAAAATAPQAADGSVATAAKHAAAATKKAAVKTGHAVKTTVVKGAHSVKRTTKSASGKIAKGTKKTLARAQAAASRRHEVAVARGHANDLSHARCDREVSDKSGNAVGKPCLTSAEYAKSLGVHPKQVAKARTAKSNKGTVRKRSTH